jgi:hypothetical protein
MNAVEQVLGTEMTDLLERLAATVPDECLSAVGSRQPTLKKRLDEMESQLTMARSALIEDYGRWRRALEDVENLWALAAYRSTTEETIEPAGSIAA